MLHVQWSQIEAECDGFREGFVKVFRNYEGVPTDEKDAQGRPINVSINSFSRHMGIPRATMQDWVKRSADARPAQPRTQSQLANDVRRAARQEPDAVIAGIEDAPEETQDRIFESLRESRAARHESIHGPAPDPDEAGERIRRRMNRAMGEETDQATDYLNGAAGDIANAVMAKERWGIRHPEAYAEARGKVTHWLAVLDADKTEVSDEDRAFLDQIGAEL